MNKPINIITVMCDARRMQTIAINCRCGHRWTERIPQELHESSMTAVFDCTKCGRHHLLRNKQLKSVDKGAMSHDRPELEQAFGVDTSRQYDA